MGSMWLRFTRLLVVSSKPVIYTHLVVSMDIPRRVGNYKLKCMLTYAVGCKCGL